MNKTVGRWSPQTERATALGVGNAGTSLGGAMAGPAMGLLAVTFGWRPAFVVVGAFGVVWVIAWLILMAEGPEWSRFVAADERETILATRGNRKRMVGGQSFGHHLRQPAVVATTCAFFGYT